MRRRGGPVARGVRLLVVGIGLVVGSFAAASPASAHTELLTVDPPAGAVLDLAPAAVTFTYSQSVPADFVEAAVTPPGGAEVRLGAEQLSVADATVSVPLTDLAVAAPAGSWTVVLRVVSADGHPVESSTGFTAGATPPVATPIPATPVPATPVPTTQPSAVPASPAPRRVPVESSADRPVAAVSSNVSGPATPAPSTVDAEAAASPATGGWSPGATAAAIIAAVVVVGGAGAFVLARRR